MELLVSSSTTVFDVGNLSTRKRAVDKKDSSSPPTPLLIITPNVVGEYPVVVFLHRTALDNTFYTTLLTHVSSHGYIIVAPQIYNILLPAGQEEVNCTASVINWLPEGLQSTLPENVKPNLLKLTLLGHSRGGTIAFALALGHAKISLTITALIGLDPVAGRRKTSQIEPKILTYIPNSFNLGGIPVMVIGTGLGDSFPACAPDGVNHKEFYNECQAPCYYFVTTEYGHMDMLDDKPTGTGMFSRCKGKIMANCMCKNGQGKKDTMRRCVGGLVVAFVRAALDGDNKDLKEIIKEPSIAPTKLDPVDYREN